MLNRPRHLDHHPLFAPLRVALFAVLAGCATTRPPIMTQPRPGDRYIGKFGPEGLEQVAVFRQQRQAGTELLLRCQPKPECRERQDLRDTYTVMRDCVDWGQPCQMEVR